MNGFKGQKCPYCGQVFSENDDIVVCPECGTPHHRGCYFEHKMCANAHKHGSFEWTPEMPHTNAGNGAPVICPRCGKQNPPLSLFCNACGMELGDVRAGESADAGAQQRPLEPYGGQAGTGGAQPDGRGYADPFGGYGDPFGGARPVREVIDDNTEFDGIKARDWAGYIGPASTPYYLANFKVQDVYKRKTAFTWSAAIVPYAYFAYRRVWWAAIVTAVLSLVLSVPSSLIMMVEMGVSPFAFTISQYNTLGTINVVCSLLYLALRLVCGIYAVYIFRRDAAKRLGRIVRGETAPVSGPSTVGVVAVVAVYFMVVSALMSVAMSMTFGVSLLTDGGTSAVSSLLGSVVRAL